jgi:hypothetical protein
MALIVEDGTLVANANTYVDDAEYTAYAAARGKTIGTNTAEREKELILAMDYIESYRKDFKGSKVSSSQALQWPRSGVYIDGYLTGSDEIPEELKRAQMEAAVLTRSMSLLVSKNTQNIQSETLGPMSVSYFQNGSWEQVRTDTIDVWLNVLLDIANNGFSFEVSRA